MWESPSWLGSAISAKVKRDSDAAQRELTANIADADRSARIAINTANLENQKDIAQMNIDNAWSIADLNRASSEKIATMQVIGNAVPKLAPLFIGNLFTIRNGDGRNSNNSGKGNFSGSTVQSGSTVTSAQQKADEFFKLEPTFKSRANEIISAISTGAAKATPTAAKLLGVAVGTANGLGAISSIPFINPIN